MRVAHEGHKPTEAIAHQAFRLKIFHIALYDSNCVYAMCQTLSVILQNVQVEKAGLGCV